MNDKYGVVANEKYERDMFRFFIGAIAVVVVAIGTGFLIGKAF